MSDSSQPTYTSESYASDYAPEVSIYQSDARIFHQPGYQYDIAAEVDSASCDGETMTARVRLRSGTVVTLAVSVYAEGVLRLKYSRGEAAFDETSDMLLPRGAAPAPGIFRALADGYTFAFGGYTLRLAKAPFALDVVDAAGAVIFALDDEKIAGDFPSPPLGFRNGAGESAPFLSWKIRNDERFFGLGEKWNKVEKTSTRATIWASDTCGSNTTDMCYKSVPVLFSTAGWGVMLHSSYRSFWEVGAFSYIAGSCLTEDPKLDCFLFFAPTLKGLLAGYTGITGRPQMPPRWAFGAWMSRCAYENTQQVEEVLARLHAEEMPCDVIHLDPLWMRTHYYYKIGVDACDFVWNEQGFPEHVAMLARYRALGFDVCFWINPYLPEGTPMYEEAAAHGYLLQSTRGGLARLDHGEPVGMIDFTNAAATAWWKEHLKALLRDGGSVLKPDYGDRVPEDALFANGRTGKEMHNLYLFLFSQAAFEAAQEVHGTGIVWRRSGYIGSQRYPGTWAGDTQVSWEGMRCCLRGGLSAGLTAEAFWSHDIGGFCGPAPTAELYIRWAQWGMLSPFTRFHGTTPREPWHYGESALAITKHYARLRYALMPYLFAAAAESVATGVPMMRHMALEFPNEPNVDTLDDQYALGADLLVAPLLTPGARTRTVYFPAGTWTALEDASVVLDGGRFHTVAAPLERLPIFVRAGAVIPRYATPPQHLKAAPASALLLDIYAGDAQREYTFTEGVPITLRYSAEGNARRLTMTPAPMTVTITLHGFRGEENGETLTLQGDEGIDLALT